MKAFQALVSLGGLLLVIGVYVLLPASSLTANHTNTLDPGASVYLYDKLNVLKFGRLTGQFSESQGNALNLYVFTEDQYTTFTTQYVPQGLFSSLEHSSGSFSVSLPSPGNYYLIFTHGTGLETSSQEVNFSLNLDGYNPVILAVGVGLLVGGAISLGVGYHLRNKYLDKLLTPAASDVVVFDKPSPPPPASG